MEVSTISAMAFSIILTISSATELDNAAFSVPVILSQAFSRNSQPHAIGPHVVWQSLSIY